MNALPLVLGTAQLGMPYGIANRNGQPDASEAAAIVSTAWEYGIREFDTAQAYGNSEAVLGDALKASRIARQARVITKIRPAPGRDAARSVRRGIEAALRRLGVPRLFGCLLHVEDDLDRWTDVLCDAFSRCVANGMIRYGGVSVYTPSRALQALDLPGIDIVQMPGNAIDRRFADAGVLVRGSEGCRFYVRSVYLQGLLLMDPDALPTRMAFAAEPLRQFREIARQSGLSPRQLALSGAGRTYPGARLLIGAETADQVREGAEDAATPLPTSAALALDALAGSVDDFLCNPVCWP